jgi:D-lactate dehydrogenase (quinone)
MNPLPRALCDTLARVLPRDGFSTESADRLTYGYDNSRLEGLAQGVVWPRNENEIIAIVRACREHRMPLIARGQGTNTTGATVPVHGGIVLSLERMNRILEIDPDNRAAVVEPGVLNGDLQEALKPHGLFWPPDPTSAAYSSIGGNLACNAGGPRAVKYGACRDNVLALNAVAGTGELLHCGSRTTKGATGYDLTRFLVGSEGTLAIITQATLKLTPLPETVRTLRALYRDVAAAAQAVARIMRQPATPCALEFMDGEALRLARDIGGADIPPAGALLMIEVDGSSAAIQSSIDAVMRAATGDGLIALDHATDAIEVQRLWAARKALSPALRSIAPMKINEDVVVPVSRVPDLVAAVADISKRSGIPIVTFGHAGNGNLHVNLMFDPKHTLQALAAPHALEEVFDRVIALGGTLSGEHGIGIAKRPFMTKAISPATLNMMRAIKAQFDPDGILNPGKLLP